MRRKLLRATLRSLADLGYTRASTTEICRRAKVSRGAQLHHFPTKAQLVAAAVEQVFEDRLADFQRFIERLGDAGPDLGAIYDYLWEIYRSDAFYVWMELVMASRTDERLRRRVREVDTRFTARAEAFCALALAGAGRGAGETPALTRLILSVLDGLAMHRILAPDDEQPRAVLAAFAALAR